MKKRNNGAIRSLSYAKKANRFNCFADRFVNELDGILIAVVFDETRQIYKQSACVFTFFERILKKPVAALVYIALIRSVRLPRLYMLYCGTREGFARKEGEKRSVSRLDRSKVRSGMNERSFYEFSQNTFEFRVDVTSHISFVLALIL